MSTVAISLRLSGNLPPSDELSQRLGVQPAQSLRRGEQLSKRRVQPVDVWLLNLTQYDNDRSTSEIDQQLFEAAAVIERMAPALAALDRTQCHAEFYISTIRDEDQGGLSLPANLLAAIAAANLSMQLSILVMLRDEEPEVPAREATSGDSRSRRNNEIAQAGTDSLASELPRSSEKISS